MTLPKDLKDVKVMREFYVQQRVAVCGLADCLDEPWKTHFNSLKGQYDEVLAALPPTDQAPAALEANRGLQMFASMLSSTSALCSLLGAEVGSMKTKHAAALASGVEAAVQERMAKGDLILATELPNRVAEEVKKLTESGALVTKETVTQLFSAAKNTGLEEGKNAMKAELEASAAQSKLISTRKTELQTCSLPCPELDSLLTGKDEDFSAAKTTAQNRIEALKRKGVAYDAGNSLFAKVWLPEAEYQAFDKLLDSIPAIKGPVPDPLLGGKGGQTTHKPGSLGAF